MRLFIFRGSIVAIIAALSICMYKMIDIHISYSNIEKNDNAMAEYAPPATIPSIKPDRTDVSESPQPEQKETVIPEPGQSKPPESESESESESEPEPQNQETVPGTNQSVLNAQKDLNEEITAWLRVPNTKIDYPVVHGEDNSFYLNHNVRKESSNAGSIFVDSRNNEGFIDFNTIIYGHNMINGSMFSDLIKFYDSAFFLESPAPELFLPDVTYTLEVFAFLRIKQDDRIIYNTITNANFPAYIEYVEANAIHYRDIQLESYDNIVTLSTCTNDAADERMVVLARLKDAGALEF